MILLLICRGKIVLSVLFFCGSLVGCGGGGQNSPSNIVIHNAEDVRAAIEGEVVSYSATYQNSENSEILNEQFTWESNIDGWLGDGLALEMQWLSVGNHEITLTLVQDNGNEVSDSTRIVVLSSTAVMDSMLFGRGGLAPSELTLLGYTNDCASRNFWSGFPLGSEITIIVSESLNEQQRKAIENNVNQVAMLSLGQLRARVMYTEELNPIPSSHEVTVTAGIPPPDSGCLPQGCTVFSYQSPGIFDSVRIVLPRSQSPQAFVHDVIGHGVLGLCHIDGNQIGDPANSLMSLGDGVYSHQIAEGLTDIDAFVVSTIYASGFHPGVSRQNLLAFGLLNYEELE